MEDFCTQKSSYFYHKILSKTQKLCTFLTSANFTAFLYVNPLINFNNSKTNQQICILATFFVLQPFCYILCCVLQSPLFKGFKLAQTTEHRPNLVNLPVTVYQRLFIIQLILTSNVQTTEKLILNHLLGKKLAGLWFLSRLLKNQFNQNNVMVI